MEAASTPAPAGEPDGPGSFFFFFCIGCIPQLGTSIHRGLLKASLIGEGSFAIRGFVALIFLLLFLRTDWQEASLDPVSASLWPRTVRLVLVQPIDVSRKGGPSSQSVRSTARCFPSRMHSRGVPGGLGVTMCSPDMSMCSQASASAGGTGFGAAGRL